MSRFWNRARTYARAVRRTMARVFIVAFILGIAAVPLPLTPFFAFLIKPMRRNLPALLVKKKADG